MRHTLTILLTLLLMLISAAPARPLAAQDCSDEAEVVEMTIDPALEENEDGNGVIAPDTEFVVEWTLLNSGDCEWSRSYRLVFTEGERMDGPRTQRLRSAVAPGESVTLALELTSPSEADSYATTWRMRNEDGDSFGPKLTLELEVGESSGVAKSDVVLPEVLVFGGMGAGDDPYLLLECLQGGELPSTPIIVLDDEGLDYRYANVLLCSFDEGTTMTVTVTDPEGNTFTRTVVETAPITVADEDDNEYTGTVTQVPLSWPERAPDGDWLVEVTSDQEGGDVALEQTITVEPPLETIDMGDDYVELDNWPAGPIDPFAAAGGCTYVYTPGQELFISGVNLPTDTVMQLGFYHSRMGFGYLADQVEVETDGEGAFVSPYTAPENPGDYNIVTMQEANPEGFHEDGTQYDYGLSEGEQGFTCLTVRLAEEPETPLRLAYTLGNYGALEIEVLDMLTGIGYYPTFHGNTCDTSEPAWWPGGEYVVFQSNCVRDEESEFIEYVAADDYDLFAVLIDPTYTVPEEELLIQLTDTPDIDETDPDVRNDNILIYRSAPAGTDPSLVSNLAFLDNESGESTVTEIYGRAPAWSPDGESFAFMSDEGGSWQVYIYNNDLDEPLLISKSCETHCLYPAWSPDGKQIIYQSTLGEDDLTPAGLWTTSASGNGRARSYIEGEYARPSWSATAGIAFEGPGGLYLGDTERPPTVERYLFATLEDTTLGAPVLSR